MNNLEDGIIRLAAQCIKVCGALPMKKVGGMGFAEHFSVHLLALRRLSVGVRRQDPG